MQGSQHQKSAEGEIWDTWGQTSEIMSALSHAAWEYDGHVIPEPSKKEFSRWRVTEPGPMAYTQPRSHVQVMPFGQEGFAKIICLLSSSSSPTKCPRLIGASLDKLVAVSSPRSVSEVEPETESLKPQSGRQ